MKLAKTKRKKGIRSPKKPGKKKVNINIGTIIILPIVNILGILNFIFIHESSHIFFLQYFLQYLLQILNLLS